MVKFTHLHFSILVICLLASSLRSLIRFSVQRVDREPIHFLPCLWRGTTSVTSCNDRCLGTLSLGTLYNESSVITTYRVWTSEDVPVSSTTGWWSFLVSTLNKEKGCLDHGFFFLEFLFGLLRSLLSV